jgi:hypothetical protein
MLRFLPVLLVLALFIPALADDDDSGSGDFYLDTYTDENGDVWVEYEGEGADDAEASLNNIPEVPDPTPVDDTAYDEDGNAYQYDEATGEWVPVGG